MLFQNADETEKSRWLWAGGNAQKWAASLRMRNSDVGRAVARPFVMSLSSAARILRQQGQVPGVFEQLLPSTEMGMGEDSAVPVGV